MSAINTALVIGGGAAGTAAAILLVEQGVDVELVEIAPDVVALGSGITLQGNALRVLRRLGVWESVRRLGHEFSTVGLRAPDGTLLAEITDARTGGPDLPAAVGMYRPDLARVLTGRADELGVRLRFATRCSALDQDADGVGVRFDDGSTGRYDLVVGADGVRSATRRMLGIDLEPEPTGMGIWRVFAPRPVSVTRTDLCYGGPAHIAGYCPTGPDALYAYLVEDAQDRTGLAPGEKLAVVRDLAWHYRGPWDEIRSNLTDPASINYTWFETHLLDGPWHRGRVVLIGDAVHVCPPTLAQGAALALEDAAVLAELLGAAERVDEELWSAFTARRLERARAVVNGSVQLGQWLLDGEEGDVPGLMAEVARVVGEPA
ncbi:FAD-dependent monooxygenase [Saccharopolyspora hirsuta]|uniref:FAD-dependent monooxygenase n=1 Tax=Saccharopolyspora hirsuta TaxID=1837 RepID=UPI0033296D37